jgi:hypothetical protein
MRTALIVWVIGLLARTVGSEFVHPFEQFCVEAISRDQSVEAVCAISPTFLAFDANYTELADQIAEDDGTVAGHPERLLVSALVE